MVEIAVGAMDDCYHKLGHLHLCDALLPSELMKGIECSQCIVAIHDNMHCRVESHYGNNSRNR